MSFLHIDFDGAWDPRRLGMPTLDLRDWGPALRYCAPVKVVEMFERSLGHSLPELVGAGPAVIVYGSGDFHYLAYLFLKQALQRARKKEHGQNKNDEGVGERAKDGECGRTNERVALVSFDNHPDWDIRPPRFACGGWVNRALELEQVSGAAVWGCGNFEFRFPHRVFRNRGAIRAGRLEVFPWEERQPRSVRRRLPCVSRGNWRERFGSWAQTLAGKAVYVTIDLDCLAPGWAMTNWENGLFEPPELAAAIEILAARARVVGADICGGYSEPKYARARQGFAASWDHPKLAAVAIEEAREVNHAALEIILPAIAAAVEMGKSGAKGMRP